VDGLIFGAVVASRVFVSSGSSSSCPRHGGFTWRPNSRARLVFVVLLTFIIALYDPPAGT
jgi:hypothetical protein